MNVLQKAGNYSLLAADFQAVTHAFVSAQSQSANANLASKDEWNDEHDGPREVLVVYNTSSSAWNLNLLAANAVPAGSVVRVKRHGANNVTVNRAGSDTIYTTTSATSDVLSSDGDARAYVTDGVSRWERV